MNNKTILIDKFNNNPLIWAELGLLFMLFMEATILATWYHALALPHTGWGASYTFILLTYICSYWLVRYLRNHKYKISVKNIATGIWFFLLLYLSTRYIYFGNQEHTISHMATGIITSIMDESPGVEGFWHLLFLPILFWRVMRLSKEIPGPFSAMSSFKISLFLVIPFAILYAPSYPAPSIIFGFIYLCSSLLMLSLTKLGYLTELRGGKLPDITFDRFSGILVGTVLTTLLAILLSWISSTSIAPILIQSIGSLWVLLSSLVIVIFLPIIALITNLFSRILPVPEDMSVSQTLSFNDLMNQIAEENVIVSPFVQFMEKYGSLILLVSIILAVVIFIIITLRWQASKKRDKPEKESDETSIRASFNLLPNFLKPFAKHPPKLANLGKLVAAARIQQIYARLMRLASQLGSPRSPAVTPLEFLPQLEVIFPGETLSLAKITDAFIRVRYGELPESEEEFTEILQAWRHLERQGIFLLGQKLTKKE